MKATHNVHYFFSSFIKILRQIMKYKCHTLAYSYLTLAVHISNAIRLSFSDTKHRSVIRLKNSVHRWNTRDLNIDEP